MNQKPHEQSRTILVIENDDILREGLVELLSLVNLLCLDTPSGREGVHLFARHQSDIDLVIMDMGLADKEGSFVIEELEELCPKVKIIIISGQEKWLLDQKFGWQPNISVVQKPFGMLGLLNTVNAQLGH